MVALARLMTLITGILMGAIATQATAYDTRAKAAYAIDLKTGTVLLSKNADAPLPPASMSKLMTVLMTFEALRDGRLQMQDKLPVSQHAMNYTGSTMFLNTRDRVSVSDLLQGVIVLSGNDACAVLAEALSPDGTEAGFAAQMTRRARQLGMENSYFSNSNGWPSPGQRMSMRDLAILAERLITDFPEYYGMFSQREFAFDGRAPANTQNRNPLLRLDIGADGLKTGHTREAGYGLVGSVKQGDRRIIFVISGLETSAARAHEAQAITNWALRQLVEKKAFNAGDIITRAKVWLGNAPDVGLTTAKDLSVLTSVYANEPARAKAVYNSPINAPITKGQVLGELVLTSADLPETRVPLIAAQDIARGGFLTRMKTAALILMQKAGLVAAPGAAS